MESGSSECGHVMHIHISIYYFTLFPVDLYRHNFLFRLPTIFCRCIQITKISTVANCTVQNQWVSWRLSFCSVDLQPVCHTIFVYTQFCVCIFKQISQKNFPRVYSYFSMCMYHLAAASVFPNDKTMFKLIVSYINE